MHKEQRHREMIDLLSMNNIMSVTELSEKLNASKMTIRRDLEQLEKKGIIKKVHGGALYIKNDNSQPSFYERIDEASEEKKKIGKAAAELIEDGDIVFFDAGTTSLSVAYHISDHIEFTAITTGLMTAIALCDKPKVNIINIGGSIHISSMSSINHMAIENICKFNANKAFISTKAVTLPEGTYEAQMPLIEIKKAIVQQSEKVILLADHSKFETKSLCKAIPLDSIDMIVTDSKIPEVLINDIKGNNIELIIVP